MESLRIMNQEGLELYKQHSSYGETKNYDAKKYNEMFEEKLKNTENKKNKCNI
ncbi:hypothetical protein acsn021_30770 [Anaerocolumna cellulosilytica]|uniref:Uncharacterized protein n=1 Tax=Anaerocolumna cellulosilytica TaxID=433286 RepID=A0A6S6R961_9FIRM|nr:hypothetical protein [Anaerocolumna cellulosilytica]MBB5198153.1 hypothetical protein [Anaerocolumna cellulosilytica]BCJ95508.1 hypothetical protein acsn021_30770 [Anaerocolumna cellulosilytica]